MQTLLSLLPLFVLACVTTTTPPPAKPESLGQFSISLTVKDLAASQRFYEGLGFTVITPAGSKYVMLRSGSATIGLFHGLFDTNTITFNPTDVRAVQARAKSAGLAFKIEATEGTGPAMAFLFDPDGNPVLLDQH